jgi:predicted nucleic acid-binding protein
LKVYLETSFIIYLTSKPSRDLIIAAHQQITHEWWDKNRQFFELYVSQFVYEEAAKGDSNASKKRIALLSDLTLLELNEDIMTLASNFIQSKTIPTEFVEDAFHIAIATVHGMDYLLTWNCKHIANASIRSAIEKACQKNGYLGPIICTPEELMGEYDVER